MAWSRNYYHLHEGKRANTYRPLICEDVSQFYFNPQPFARTQIRFQFRKLLCRHYFCPGRNFHFHLRESLFSPKQSKRKHWNRLVSTSMMIIKFYRNSKMNTSFVDNNFSVRGVLPRWKTIIISCWKLLLMQVPKWLSQFPGKRINITDSTQ